MPLDGHSYLVAQGWGGKGTGLREGAISRPIAVSKKNNLAGLGKDRDEAFPFWDHLFSAAASAIKVHVDDSDDEGAGSSHSGDEGKSKDTTRSSSLAFKRTETGIISNRRPVNGISAHTSGTSTPSSSSSDPSSSSSSGVTQKLSLLTIAKRDAARRGLYSRFFRGPVLGPDAGFEKQVRESSPKPQYIVGEGEETMVKALMVRQLENVKKEAEDGLKETGKDMKDGLKGGGKKKRSKEDVDEEDASEVADDSEKTRRKEEKAEKKRAKEEKRKEKEDKRKRKEKKAKEKEKEDTMSTEVKEGGEAKEKKNSKGMEKALDEPEAAPVSVAILDESTKKKTSSKDKKSSKKKEKELAGETATSKGSKKSKRRREAEEEEDTPKKKKKRKDGDSGR